uniref:Uncharacterized protein n=1 Tax=Oryza meridionalis TaxID=40149 RepID=A0A0E0DWK9_9ORYZ
MEEGIHEYFCPSRHDLIGKEAGDEGCHNPAWPDSGFFSLVYWDHDGDDILQGNHITVGQCRKKETGQRH